MRVTIGARIGETRVAAHVEGEVRATPEASLAAFLFPAMQSGEALQLDEPVSPALLAAVPTLQDVFAVWWPQHRHVPVHAQPASRAREGSSRGVGCFFSGGVDSFYSALRHQSDITHLVFAQGFDIPLSEPDLLERATAAAREAASALGKPLIVVRTDLKEVVDPLLSPPSWPYYHGAALAAVGHLLSHLVHTMIIPASHTYLDLFPWGSHPLVDHLWSSEQLEFVHHGAADTRFAKVQAIAGERAVLDHLRVCWRNPDGAYNCGRCEKCVRTMIALRVAGTLDECATLPSRLDLSAVRRMWLQNANDVAYADENLVGARAAGHRALTTAIRYAKLRSALGRLLPRELRPIVKRVARRSKGPRAP